MCLLCILLVQLRSLDQKPPEPATLHRAPPGLSEAWETQTLLLIPLIPPAASSPSSSSSFSSRPAAPPESRFQLLPIEQRKPKRQVVPNRTERCLMQPGGRAETRWIHVLSKQRIIHLFGTETSRIRIRCFPSEPHSSVIRSNPSLWCGHSSGSSRNVLLKNKSVVKIAQLYAYKMLCFLLFFMKK